MSTTASCFCGAVQLAFSLEGDNLVDSFICNCTDCHKITASAFASNFIIKDDTLEHVKGADKLTKYARSEGIASGNTMTNYFCKECGTLLYRVSSGFPGKSIMRIGTVDDYEVQSTRLRPRVEQFTKDRVAWLGGGVGVKQVEGNYFVSKSNL